MAVDLYWVLGAGLLVMVVAAMSPRSKSKLPRLGPDPGVFNIKMWLSRHDFRSNNILIEQGYQMVCQNYPRLNMS